MTESRFSIFPQSFANRQASGSGYTWENGKKLTNDRLKSNLQYFAFPSLKKMPTNIAVKKGKVSDGNYPDDQSK